jgi:LPXTG-site transpeptidase (sortase) family protein
MTQAEELNSTNAPKPGRRLAFALGIGMIAIGTVVLIAIGGYYGIGLYGTSKLDELNATFDGPVALPELPSNTTQIHGALMPDGSFKPINQVVTSLEAFMEAGGVPVESESAKIPVYRPAQVSPVRTVYPAFESSLAEISPSNPVATEPVAELASVETIPPDAGVLVSNYNSIYPGFQIHPKYWGDPLWAGTDPYTYGVVRRPDGFTALSAADDGLARGLGSQAREIRIPSIGVSSAVKDLEVIDLGDSSTYETPDNIVGRISTTAQAGEAGNAWFFGHLESPIKGEGNVFQNLPLIPEMLKNGDPVYVTIVTDDGEYLYQITETKEVHQDELVLQDTDDSTITLVACVPRLVYDHRILVTGKLVGVKRG